VGELVVVGAGGFLGAIARYTVAGWVEQRWGGRFPYGTLAVNVAGCFLIGVLMTLAHERGVLGNHARALLVVGFLGSLTTFSTFGWETHALLRGEQLLVAGASVAANVLLGLAAVVAGRAAVHAF
jgi:CrcB protein